MTSETEIKTYPRKDRGGWIIYLPSKLIEDSSFPFKPKDKLMIRIEEENLIIKKKRTINL